MKRITTDYALHIYKTMPLLELGQMADNIRKSIHTQGVVTFIIDRNINYTNVCINRCRFCAFYKEENSPEAYILTAEELLQKIKEATALGAIQILLQGGLHPALGLDFITDMLKLIKDRFNIHIHGFSPPEIYYLAELTGISIKQTLLALKEAGLGSMPGGGAEILADRVRRLISPKKINSKRWLEVMEEAHNIGLRTTATMMFGTVETPEDIIEHLCSIRDLQDRTGGFTAFIPWSFQPKNTQLVNDVQPATGVEYLRVLALSRVFLDNIQNLQASWVTQGIKMAQVALRFGANDMGSTMIEENVVKAAGVCYRVSEHDITTTIKKAGFTPATRDTFYNIVKYYK
ncbi:MAG: dehypoxanthine futalosine cyclase [Candidatus Magnetoovum sp. WYHC-5]|nr:dehypoxanthine futalosine cyclase [Candidatus Magnetoovum sp. WYHC-5]